MGVPEDKEKKPSGPQARRDSHYFETGVSPRHERDGAQFKPKDGERREPTQESED
jgi:hypothetical protein